MADLDITSVVVQIIGQQKVGSTNYVLVEVIGDLITGEGVGSALVGGAAIDETPEVPGGSLRFAEGGVTVGGKGSTGNEFEEIAEGGAFIGGAALSYYNKISTVIAQVIGQSKAGEIFAIGAEVIGDLITNSVFQGAILGGESIPTGIQSVDSSGGAEIAGTAIIDVVNIIIEGGVEAGGESDVNLITPETGSGGVEIGGDVVFVAEETGSGGVEIGGDDIDTMVVDETATSGGEVGGAGVFGGNTSVTGSGGAEVGGFTEIGVITNRTASGGVEVAGDGDPDFSDIVDTDGGVEAGGDAIATVEYNISTSGGIETVGGAEAGGTASITSFATKNTSGGVVSGTSSVEYVGYNISTSGGIEAAGEAFAGRAYDEIASGGIEAAGLSTQVIRISEFSSGGSEVGGDGTQISYHSDLGDDGTVVGGLANNIIIVNSTTPSEGALVGSTALTGFFMEEYGNGGILISGDDVDTLFDFVIATGGMLVGGSISIAGVINVIVEGGAVLAGLVDAYIGYDELSYGGAVIAGINLEQTFKNPQITSSGAEIGGSGINVQFSEIDSIGGALLSGLIFNQLIIASPEIIGTLEIAGEAEDIPFVFSQNHVKGLSGFGRVMMDGELSADDVDRQSVVGQAIPVAIKSYGPTYVDAQTALQKKLNRWEKLKKKILEGK